MAAGDDRVDADAIRTVAAPSTVELPRIKGSRFVGDLAPAGSPSVATGFVDAIRRRHPDASHHCWAWRLADGRHRDHDDGEPGGTAGPPLARHLAGADLVDVVVVATRWFGGTKLGTGGLVRAYGDTASAAIEQAEITVRVRRITLTFTHDYDLSGTVDGVVTAHDARPESTEYAARVDRVVAVPRARAEAFVTAMTDATSGRVVPTDPKDGNEG